MASDRMGMKIDVCALSTMLEMRGSRLCSSFIEKEQKKVNTRLKNVQINVFLCKGGPCNSNQLFR